MDEVACCVEVAEEDRSEAADRLLAVTTRPLRETVRDLEPSASVAVSSVRYRSSANVTVMLALPGCTNVIRVSSASNSNRASRPSIMLATKDTPAGSRSPSPRVADASKPPGSETSPSSRNEAASSAWNDWRRASSWSGDNSSCTKLSATEMTDSLRSTAGLAGGGGFGRI